MSYKYMEYLKKNYKIGLMIAIVFFFLMINTIFSAEPPTVIQPIKEEVVLDKEEVKEEYIYIDIKGEVLTPGVYKMNVTDRVIDAVFKAGGITEYADTKTVNLSTKLTDELLIYIPKLNEIVCPVIDAEVEEGKVSINKATVTELMMLPGIGEAKANDIINYRNEVGSFKTIEDIKNVNGIGDATFNNIKDLITI